MQLLPREVRHVDTLGFADRLVASFGSCVALQPRLGILSQRRCRDNSTHPRDTDVARIRPPLNRTIMIRKLKSGGYRLYSRKKDPRTGRSKNLGTFKTREEAQKHERAVQYFKHA